MFRDSSAQVWPTGERTNPPPPESTPMGRERPPRTWLLLAHRAGDNAQVVALAEALGWPFEIKRFVYNCYESLVSWPFFTTLAGVRASESSALAPPWPDLVLTSGRRNEPIARWIQKQDPERVRRVHIGRPWERIENWDLIVTTPQYGLPRAPNIVHNELPLQHIHTARLRKAAWKWAPKLAALPKPRIAVSVGGSSGPFVFDRPSAQRLGEQISEMAGKLGGSLLVTTSPRTPRDAAETLFRAIHVPAYCYHWSPDETSNPYLAFLGVADRVVVTGDSVSMMAEACATGKPVYLYDIGRGRNAMRDASASAAPPEPWTRWLQRRHLKAWIYRTNMRYGPRRLSRDIRIIHRALIDSGRAAWLGHGHPTAPGAPLRDVPRAVARVRALFPEAALTVPQPTPPIRARMRVSAS